MCVSVSTGCPFVHHTMLRYLGIEQAIKNAIIHIFTVPKTTFFIPHQMNLNLTNTFNIFIENGSYSLRTKLIVFKIYN